MSESNFPIRPGDPGSIETSFVGRGFYWPMEVDHTGSIRLTSTDEDVERSMRIILSTAPGERLMRPRFGCEIWDLLFEPVTPELFGRIAHAVFDALGQWEPRVEIESVTPFGDEDDASLVNIHVAYTMRDTNEPHNLVFPFYVIPHEE
ncbi:GPW/gp25 family protein [Jatrophihabitans fulvus]